MVFAQPGLAQEALERLRRCAEARAFAFLADRGGGERQITGDQRKAALLKKFGSVQRLRLASVEEIAAVSGFGGKAAGELMIFLQARSGELLEQRPGEKVSASPEKTPEGCD